jgi:hypothetical protein
VERFRATHCVSRSDGARANQRAGRELNSGYAGMQVIRGSYSTIEEIEFSGEMMKTGRI